MRTLILLVLTLKKPYAISVHFTKQKFLSVLKRCIPPFSSFRTIHRNQYSFVVKFIAFAFFIGLIKQERMTSLTITPLLLRVE